MDDLFDPFSELQPGLYPNDGGPVDNDGHILMEMRREIESVKQDFSQTWLEPSPYDNCQTRNQYVWVTCGNCLIEMKQTELGGIYK